MNIKKLLFAGLLFFFFAPYGSLRSQSIMELSYYAPLPSIFEVKYINNHLIISQQGMRIMDVSNPFNPQLVSQASYPGNFAYQIAVEGVRAYMAKGGGGHFEVYTISNFNSPVFEGSVQIPATEFLLYGDLVPFGNYVYMAGHDSLYVLNVSNVNSPQLVTTIQIPGGEASEMAINDNTLYITGPTSIRIYNLSNPPAPSFVNQISNRHTYHQGIAIDRTNDRFFTTWSSTLRDFVGYDAYSISNPSAPEYLFSDSSEFSGGDFGVTNYYNNILFISQGGRVKAFDVSSIGHGFVTSFLGQNVANASVSIEVKDSIFFNARRSGIEILRYSGPFPTLISNSVTGLTQNSVQVTFSGERLLNIQANQNMNNAVLKIYNILGQSMYSDENLSFVNGQSKIISLKNFSSGIYFLTIRGTDNLTTQKFVIR